MEYNCTCEAGYRGEVIHCPFHAAAPHMYEALKAILDEKALTYTDPIRGLVVSALNKAEGR